MIDNDYEGKMDMTDTGKLKAYLARVTLEQKQAWQSPAVALGLATVDVPALLKMLDAVRDKLFTLQRFRLGEIPARPYMDMVDSMLAAMVPPAPNIHADEWIAKVRAWASSFPQREHVADADRVDREDAYE